MKPRRILKEDSQQDIALDTFGVIEGVEKLDKGWLSNETSFQFKFYNNPFSLNKQFENCNISVKVSITSYT